MLKYPLGTFRLRSGRSRQSSDFLLEFSISNERREPAIAAEFAPVLRIANTREDYLPHTLFLILIQWCPSEALKKILFDISRPEEKRIYFEKHHRRFDYAWIV